MGARPTAPFGLRRWLTAEDGTSLAPQEVSQRIRLAAGERASAAIQEVSQRMRQLTPPWAKLAAAAEPPQAHPLAFRRAAIIYNPASGRPRERETAVEVMVRRLEISGLEAVAMPTALPNHATELARQAIADGCDLIIAHGGDGTMNEVLQAVVGTEATLAFWPGGTANVLATEIHFPVTLEGVAQRILRGQVERVTVGKANERYFLLMAGIGLDAAVTIGVDPELKKKFGKAAFAISALKVAYEWNLAPFRVHLPGGEEIVARFVVAGNAHSYGGGFQVTPRADLKDEYLDLCIFTSDKRINYVLYATAAFVGAHSELDGVIYRKVKRCRITEASDVCDQVQLDGEVSGRLPLDLEAIPQGVKLLV